VDLSYYSLPAKMTSPRHFTPAEIARHSTPADLWIIIDGDVYDLSSFTAEHPGGPKGTLSSPSCPHSFLGVC
jgi:cytochrome b involved in lipid metabolism